MLKGLAIKYGANKMAPETFAFIGAYEKHFNSLRLEVTSILEIGVKDGGSLRMWKDYFPNAKILGIDVDKDCLKHKAEKIDVIISDQSDVAFLTEFRENNSFDIIIDDGGHKMKHQLRSFEYLWSIAKKWYVIEDLHTSYWPKFDGKYLGGHTTITYLKSLIDDINYRAIVHPKAMEHKCNWNPLGIKSIHFYPGIVFIEKE